LPKRVAITGLGAVTPIGLNVKDTWENALSGKSGIRNIDPTWSEGLSAKIAGTIEIDSSEILGKVQARRMDRSSQLGVIMMHKFKIWTKNDLVFFLALVSEDFLRFWNSTTF
jgi:3-oxoacyl-(acyl-carrier-protein) synthase